MNITKAHVALAEKFLFKENLLKDVPVPDSLKKLTALAFTEEEAELVLCLTFTSKTATQIARRAKRPVAEVRPLLESLADRLLITGLKIKGLQTYAFLNFVPGLFEAQMIRSKCQENNPELRDYFIQFASLFSEFYEEIMPWIRKSVEGKDFRFTRIIPVEKSLANTGGIIPHSTDSFLETIDRNNSFCLVHACACRQEKRLIGEGCDKPLGVCSAMGWLADFAIDKGLARRVTKKEYIEAKTMAAEAGLVNMTDNLINPLQVCSCCSCCCGALRMLRLHNIPTIVAGSRFEARVTDEKCNACGKCAQICPMEAVVWEKKHPPVKIDYSRCIGCGLCVTACSRENAMSLRERADYSPPSKNLLDYYADRYREAKGDNISIGQGLKLGAARIIGRISPFSVSGPGYHPNK